MKDAIDELVARSKPDCQLNAFHQLHRTHPEILDFLVAEVRLRLAKGFGTFSYHSLWEYARWKLDFLREPGEAFLMNDHAAPYYARAITILHPAFNGRARFKTSRADSAFGTRLEAKAKRLRAGFVRLQWANGTALEEGWRPLRPHVPLPASRRPDVHPRELGRVNTMHR